MANTSHNVVNVNHITDTLFELVIDRNDLAFTPGDCVALFNDCQSDSRPYSISSGTNEPVLRFLIRRMKDGCITSYLSSRTSGDSVVLSPPFGWFRPGETSTKGDTVFIATGTGIAPFLSACRSFPDHPPACCLYGVRHTQDAAGFEELRDITTCYLTVSQEDADGSKGIVHGRVTDYLDKIPLDPANHYYLCGLDAMINDVSTWLEAKGIDFFNIHREVFFNDNTEQ